ncbi:MAG: F0F1 ATP synthase subunit delta [Treponema sp.]|nr:F0F1 ATP synthase subunit delta [Treponema sp.]
MQNINRWAKMFLAVFGDAGSENAQETFLYLKALAVPVKSIKGVFFGSNASEKLEKVLRDSAAANSAAADSAVQPDVSIEYAIRFLCLLIEKNSLKYIDLILSRIELLMNEKNDILDITIESAAPLDNDFTQELAQTIKEKTNAHDLNIKTCVRPELLGGYLLRTNGFYIDATLKGQTEKMLTELSHLNFDEYEGGITSLQGG